MALATRLWVEWVAFKAHTGTHWHTHTGTHKSDEEGNVTQTCSTSIRLRVGVFKFKLIVLVKGSSTLGYV